MWYMNIRETKTKNKYGDEYTYLQLVHNHRDKKTGKTVTEVYFNLGRKDRVDLEFIRNAVNCLSRLLEESSVSAPPLASSVHFIKSRAYGAVFLLGFLWDWLGMGRTIAGLVHDRQFRSPVERMCFALVAGRILDHSSKLSLECWVRDVAYVPELPCVDVHALYRVMDFLLENEEAVQRSVFMSVAKEAKLDVDVVFLDTTNTYFECTPDDPEGLFSSIRQRGHSKDKHPELPLVSVAFAVTRGGIPVRHWTFPGNTSDQSIVEKVKDDLSEWNLGNVIMVSDAGFNSEDNRRILRHCCGDFIIGEKLRTGTKGTAVEAMHRGGRYKKMTDDLFIKDVIEDKGLATERRFVIVKSTSAEKYDRAVREDIIKETDARLSALKQVSGEAHTKKACELRSHPAYGRYLKQKEDGTLAWDREKIAKDELLDGKFLVSTSNMKMAAEDVVKGYKQLWAVERVFRDMKNIINLRPVYHRNDDRIRCHMLICWMSMILIRVAEAKTGMTWRCIEREMEQVTAAAIETGDSVTWMRSDMTKKASEILSKFKAAEPKPLIAIEAKKDKSRA